MHKIDGRGDDEKKNESIKSYVIYDREDGATDTAKRKLGYYYRMNCNVLGRSWDQIWV